MSGKKGAGAGPLHWGWKGGRTYHSSGYVLVYQPGHPRAHQGHVMEHVLVAECATGIPLPRGVVVHHRNQQKDDNRPANLVILQNQGEHKRLHVRLECLRAGGRPHTQRLCGKCGVPKDFGEFFARNGWCLVCRRAYNRKRTGALPRAPIHSGAKLSPEDVLLILADVQSGQRQTDVAAKYGTTKFVVNDIIHGRKWRSVTGIAAPTEKGRAA